MFGVLVGHFRGAVGMLVLAGMLCFVHLDAFRRWCEDAGTHPPVKRLRVRA